MKTSNLEFINKILINLTPHILWIMGYITDEMEFYQYFCLVLLGNFILLVLFLQEDCELVKDFEHIVYNTDSTHL
jgi:hypothetical protein